MATTIISTESAPEAQWKKPGIADVMRKEWADHRRSLLIGMGAYLGLWFVLGMIFGFFGGRGGDTEVGNYVAISMVFTTFLASKSFGDMTRPEGRLTVLMQPVTTWNKFWPRLLYSTLGAVIAVMIGYLVLECGRILSYLIMFHECTGIYSPAFIAYKGDYLVGYLSFFLWWLLGQSIFFYGGILWPKVSFIKTLGVCMAFMTVMLIGGTLTLSAIFDNGYTIVPLISDDALVAIFDITMLLLSALFYWLSYRRLKYSTVLYRLRQRS